MSQVAAFNQCIGPDGEQAIVFCADSQETRGSFKKHVLKLITRPEKGRQGKWEHAKALFTGAGDGALIDKLIDEMWQSAEKSGAPNIEGWEAAMQEACLLTHEKFWKKSILAERNL